MELRLPFEAGMEPDQTNDIPIPLGAVGLDVVTLGLGEQRRLEPPGGAKPKWRRYGAQPVGSGDGRFAFEMLNLTGPDRQLPPDWQLPGTETQSVRTGNDWFACGLPSPMYPGPGRH